MEWRRGAWGGDGWGGGALTHRLKHWSFVEDVEALGNIRSVIESHADRRNGLSRIIQTVDENLNRIG